MTRDGLSAEDVHTLAAAMRRDAWAYRARGDDRSAQLSERCATQLEEALARKEPA